MSPSPRLPVKKRRRSSSNGWSKKKSQKTHKKNRQAEPIIEQVVMTKSELAEWTKWFKTPRKLEQYLRAQADDPDGLLDPFYQSLAHLYYYSFEPNFYHVAYDQYYNWKHVPACSLDDHDCRRLDFTRGDKLFLQIKASPQKKDNNDSSSPWREYLYLATSQYGDGHTLGLYAARAFPAGSCLGLYLGPCAWSSERVGTAIEASTDFWNSLSSSSSSSTDSNYHLNEESSSFPCLCVVRDKTGRMRVINPKRVAPGMNPEPLYLAMHYIRGTEEPDVPVSLPNCEIIDDGGVFSTRAIKAHEELVSGIVSAEED